HRAVRAVGVDEELPVTTVEARGHPAVAEAGAIEIAEDALLARHLHRAVVVRARLAARLVGVARRAGLPADERRRARTLRFGPAATDQGDRGAESRHQHRTEDPAASGPPLGAPIRHGERRSSTSGSSIALTNRSSNVRCGSSVPARVLASKVTMGDE